jgi:ribosomal protein S12 methylthiotransferase
MKKTLCLVSLGCPKNLVDSEVILGLLSKEGYALTTKSSEAETIIINTCSFIEDATREATGAIHQYAQQKKRGRCQHLIVAGCLPRRYGKNWKNNFPTLTSSWAQGLFKNFPTS